MALSKLIGLTTHLINANVVAVEQIDSWMESGELETTSKNLGQGMRVCRLRYDAVISVERFSSSPQLLFALVTTWLLANDSERDDQDLPDPQVEIDINDGDTADIELKVPFYENVELVQDDKGVIDYLGNQWAISPVPVDPVNEVAVGDNPSLPTDKSYVYAP